MTAAMFKCKCSCGVEWYYVLCAVWASVPECPECGDWPDAMRIATQKEKDIVVSEWAQGRNPESLTVPTRVNEQGQP